MSEISTRIRKYLNNPEVNDPEVTKHYGRWCMFNRDQRRQIRELCNTCDMFEKTADSFWQETERLKAEIERLQKHNTDMARKHYQDGKTEAVKEFSKRFMEAFTPTMVALLCIGEILVDVSKSHISQNKAIDDIREYLSKAICSRYQLEKTIDNLVKEFTEGEKQ